MADRPSGQVLIAAPTGRDSFLAADVLGRAGVPTRICADLAHLAAGINPDVGAVLLAEEALTNPQLATFLTALRAQPASEERLVVATDVANVGTWDYLPLTGELIWNDHCRAHFGLPPEAPVNYEVFLAGVHPDDRARVNAVVKSMLSPETGGRMD